MQRAVHVFNHKANVPTVKTHQEDMNGLMFYPSLWKKYPLQLYYPSGNIDVRVSPVRSQGHALALHYF